MFLALLVQSVAGATLAASLSHDNLLRKLMQEALERKKVPVALPGGFSPPAKRQDPLLRKDPRTDPLLRQLMISAVQQALEEEGDLFTPPQQRQDPLLRQLRARGEQREVDMGLAAPRYRQDPLLRQLKNDVVDTFKFDFLSLPKRKQDSLLQQLQGPGSNTEQINNLLPPLRTQDPLLRQLDGSGPTVEEFLAAMLSPTQAQTDRPPNRRPVNFEAMLELLEGVRSSLTGGRPQPLTKSTPGGVDFSQAVRMEDGRLCVVREEEVETLESSPRLACSHRQEEQCHQTYVTFFTAAQEEQCEENFEKRCSITFRSKAQAEPVQSCRRPLVSVCDGAGPEQCREELESSCSTRLREESPGTLRPDTRCESVPVSVCGRGCVTREGEQECREEMVDTLVQVPEEVCDLQPQKSCRPVTRLVPSLRPTQECSSVPREVCSMQPGQQRLVKRPLVTEWCMDEGLQQVASLASYDNTQ